MLRVGARTPGVYGMHPERVRGIIIKSRNQGRRRGKSRAVRGPCIAAACRILYCIVRDWGGAGIRGRGP